MMIKQVFFSSSGHSLLLRIPVFLKKEETPTLGFPKKKGGPTDGQTFFFFRSEEKGGMVDRRPTGISVENREGKEEERERERERD